MKLANFGAGVATAILLVLAACAASGVDAKAVDAQVSRAQTSLDAAKGEYEKKAAEATAEKKAAFDAGDKTAQAEAAAKQKVAETTLARIAELEKKASDLKAAVATATKPDGTIDVATAAGSVGAFLPPPWNLIAMVGVPLIVGGIQQLRIGKEKSKADQLDEDARSIVNYLDAMRSKSATLATEMQVLSKATDVQEHLTPGAAAIIDDERVT
ncbi:MAG: hypothetical protein ACREJD_05850 [Phycisphaerales bacterium]